MYNFPLGNNSLLGKRVLPPQQHSQGLWEEVKADGNDKPHDDDVADDGAVSQLLDDLLQGHDDGDKVMAPPQPIEVHAQPLP